jgi:hypothetical protein
MSGTAMRTAVLAAFVVAITSCRGSSGPPALQVGPPLANAGLDRTVWRGDLVTLDGRGSSSPGGGALAFRWRQLAGEAVPLSDERAAQPTFVAPHVTTVLRFALEVSDGRVTSEPDEVVVSVKNRAPYASAGPDQIALVGNVVTLRAAGVGDPDGDPLTTTWFQTAGPPVVLVAHADGSVSFVAPATAAVLEFGVTASDGEATSPASDMRVQVVDEAANWPPLANAGPDPTRSRGPGSRRPDRPWRSWAPTLPPSRSSRPPRRRTWSSGSW